MSNSSVYIQDIIKDVIIFKYYDIIDKTKCSVTAKNIFNYITNMYSNFTEQISWNDTLFNNYVGLEEFIKINKENCVFYVYYEHVTGETSHYFIMIYDNYGKFHLMQSAVFEYSIMDWLYPDNVTCEYKDTNVENKEIKMYLEEQNTRDELERDNIVERIKLSKNLKNDQFVYNMKLLEGQWKGECDKKCKLFTENFACKMDPERLSKVFNNYDNDSKFKFRQVKTNKIVLSDLMI
jgi:hypothetical protein